MKRPLFVGVIDSLTNSVVPNRYASARRDDIQLVAADVFATEMCATMRFQHPWNGTAGE